MTSVYHLYRRHFVTWRQEASQAKGKPRIVDLRFGNFNSDLSSVSVLEYPAVTTDFDPYQAVLL
jgi:hypothetical protein